MTDLTRVTVNLIPPAVRALDRLTAGGTLKTDEVNAALRLAAAMRPLAAEDGSVAVTGPDGQHVRIYVL